jgi:polyphenol oxidase
MKAEGILDENIKISRICTKCRTDLFFSYRGEQVTGRFSAVLGFKQTDKS